MIIRPADRTASVKEYYFSRKLKEIDSMNAERTASGLPKVINLGDRKSTRLNSSHTS